jgi:hypothetical protein
MENFFSSKMLAYVKAVIRLSQEWNTEQAVYPLHQNVPFLRSNINAGHLMNFILQILCSDSGLHDL